MIVYIYNPNTLKTEKGLKFEASLGNSKILSQICKNKKHIHTNQFLLRYQTLWSKQTSFLNNLTYKPKSLQ